MTLVCRISIADSWFFREARAHDAIGAGQIDSMFPPPAPTLIGALRTALGDYLEVDWQAFARGEANPEAHALIGCGSDLGQMRVKGPYIARTVDKDTHQRIYPAPAALLRQQDTANIKNHQGRTSTVTLHRLHIGQPIRSDMGEIALPEINSNTPAGAKPLNDAWLSEQGLSQWLSGNTPDADTAIHQHDIIDYESRLGIARNNHLATVQEGMLFQTRHIRMRDPSLVLSLTLDGLSEKLEIELDDYKTSLRLGGEGREAGVSIRSGQLLSAFSRSPCTSSGLTLYLATPALIDHGRLPNFTPALNDNGNIYCWNGEIHGVRLRLVSAATYRQQRIGGWDMKTRSPKPIRSLTPAGSVFYCELTDPDIDINEAIKQLTGCQIGEQQNHGYGELIAGYWPEAEHPHAR